MNVRFLVIAAVLATAIPIAALEQVSTHRTWSVLTEEPGMCLARGTASEVDAAVTGREEVYVQVTSFPMMNFEDEVFAIPGYTYASGAPISATVDGGETFRLEDDGYKSVASDADKHRLVAAMRAGETLFVKGRNDQGVETVDAFPLAGFEQAYAELSALCER